jgi:hypothetical protein
VLPVNEPFLLLNGAEFFLSGPGKIYELAAESRTMGLGLRKQRKRSTSKETRANSSILSHSGSVMTISIVV